MNRRADRIGESKFEDVVVEGFRHCDANGKERWYRLEPPRGDAGTEYRFSRDSGIDEPALLNFLRDTQIKEVQKVERHYGGEWCQQVINRLIKVINDQGLLKTLRDGFSMVPGAHFRLVWFKPSNQLNPELVQNYELNRFVVTRQLRFGTMPKTANESIDVVLMVNGFPLVTMELKNHQTGQNVFDAINQYKQRDMRELIFKPDMRSLVHFAVDSDLAYMTTKLDGDKTFFLPFNKGNGKDGGGNPANSDGGFKTEYLWKEVLNPDSLLEIIEKFIQIEYRGQDSKPQLRQCPANISKVIFPRYHQLNVVRKLVTSTRDEGPGHNYLIQHSTGSGKSNSIAWLAYELSSLTQPNGDAFFDSIIVLTDRVILDRQLQRNITAMAHKNGVVRKVEHNSHELLDAINAGVRIIISTIQKFPYIYEQTNVTGRSFAIIIDEAHSSQSGEAHRKTKEALGDHSRADDSGMDEYAGTQVGEPISGDEFDIWNDNAITEDQDDAAVRIKREMDAQGTQSNLSFYAFTATPKPVTLETFGRKGEDDRYEAFDLYSMKQAIEEGFILDTLRNYTTFQTYFDLVKTTADDPDKLSARATRNLMNFVKLHETNIEMKSKIILDHFCSRVAGLLRGQAKAMIVTDSRAAAIKYYRCIEKLSQQKQFRAARPVVAFSGSKVVDGEEASEESLNGFPSLQIAKRFDTDEFNIMIVANKFQTGFDQPKLCAMYVDKMLTGIAAVQTLSRLNRTYPGKDDPFVLDFVNSTDTIQASFEPYYTISELDRATDPNAVYDMKTELDGFNIVEESDVEKLAAIWYGKPDASVLPQVLRLLSPAIDRFKDLSDDRQDEYKLRVSKFVRSYLYITQMIRLDDEYLLKYNTYLQFLNRELMQIRPDNDGDGDIDGEVALAHLSIEKIGTSAIELEGGEKLKNAGGSAGVKKPEPKEPLSVIVQRLNDLFGTEYGTPTQKFVEAVAENLDSDERLKRQAQNNSRADFSELFQNAFTDALLDTMTQNQELFTLISGNAEALSVVKDGLFDYFFNKANKE
ncbi:type I restriction endonuclease subunit R [Bifidobacterium oedipodis]|uniref:Helicase type I site-specific restriction-modification system restriction subunit n=1 Tax=Bifidobacterium oedipodis TaxID=2675322 RepID=A0A7Y0EMQ9_9BIFI|nr:DEAD/DEAH box helicase family protein [Bifidobacterium sp. DSM 109957]NMM93117.1 helicase type I site-specific restriction-modification system restriction subunit [Bifidobacterium sp. DSM 109957]